MPFKVGTSAEFTRRFSQDDFDRFAALSHDDNPIHVDAEYARSSYFGATVCHGMLLYSTLARGLSEQLPGPGTVPIEQELIFPNATYVGDEVTARIAVTDVEPDGGLVLDTSIFKLGESGRRIFTCLGRARVRPPGLSGPLAVGRIAGPDDETDMEVNGISVGQRAMSERVFTAPDVAAYAELTGDRNPIHLDRAAAQAAGLSARVVPAPLIGGMFSDLLGTELPGRGTGWMKQRLTYPRPAFLDTPYTATVEVVRIRADKEIVNLSTRCEDDRGRVVCLGEALVWVHHLARGVA